MESSCYEIRVNNARKLLHLNNSSKVCGRFHTKQTVDFVKRTISNSRDCIISVISTLLYLYI